MISDRTINALWRSWIADEGISAFDDLHSWIKERNEKTAVTIERTTLSECAPWYYDSQIGQIRTPNGSFFQVRGIRKLDTAAESSEMAVMREQPIIVQDEIGFLGIICKEFDGVMHFLMQAKIEPGNINKVQISPTIQATRSNFLQLHGGKQPAYLRYFLNSAEHCILVDQIQSEQSARFIGKRNRNVMILVEEDIEVLPSHTWMTLGQIKQMMRFDNLVNMDTRTVLSCIPWSFWNRPGKNVIEQPGVDANLVSSILQRFDPDPLNLIYNAINDFKMFDTTRTELLPLHSLSSWDMLPDKICHKEKYPFRVIYCDISIEDREVQHWRQPLFEAQGIALFGLLIRIRNSQQEFLVRLKPEIGCFDKVELGPTVQIEANSIAERTQLDDQFIQMLQNGKGIIRDVFLSEEGGRFFCEQNRNVIITLGDSASEWDGIMPENCFWVNYSTLNLLLRANNVLNVQLRNLLSLLDIVNQRPE